MTPETENLIAEGMTNMPAEIREMADLGALFVVNHSAGKDSQSMMIYLKEIGISPEQMLVIHADLGEVEWAGNLDHIRNTVGNVEIITAEAKTSFFEMVERRQMFPSPSQRQCTSDLKRGPIEREIRRYLKAHPEFRGLVVNCMGMRAQESASRAKKSAVQFSNRNSKAGRHWFDWLPIHHLTTAEVFRMIEDAGQQPHYAYQMGMTRLSCCFCIMASVNDLTVAAKANPELYARYVATEKRLGHTLSMSRKPLEEITGIKAAA
ncbi:3'-phosphoadenosine 5'-phosphosulfate sulfotransferase (PAPS reductase)/FAD synthetase [Aliiroseovarius crassostreae]|nr:phosphoadenosine phosphosulfate reductase family protein [Aliiroseovarius crassostreae]SFU98809.1 3'-phosphoadenosine 5'-phosphosulfate sulfotransferase (PAPS reductase)/FAD synthetase [Aliiroseovarius crassostreae]